MIYSNASRILCLQNEINRTRSHRSRIFIEISTSNTELINYSLQLENITEFLLEYEEYKIDILTYSFYLIKNWC
jgi:hypothetical protein